MVALKKSSLQMFRKQAIYRRMKFYSREHERAQAQITELEKRRDFLQANFTLIAACWEQVSFCSFAKNLVLNSS